jgi:hypothetical protein
MIPSSVPVGKEYGSHASCNIRVHRLHPNEMEQDTHLYACECRG